MKWLLSLIIFLVLGVLGLLLFRKVSMIQMAKEKVELLNEIKQAFPDIEVVEEGDQIVLLGLADGFRMNPENILLQMHQAKNQKKKKKF